MKRTLTDLSQLSKAMFKAAPKVDEIKPEPPKAKSRADGADVLAYFSRSTEGGKSAPSPSANPLAEELSSLRAQLRAAEAARSQAETDRSTAERERTKLTNLLAAAQKEVEQLKGECGHLRDEMNKTARTVPDATDAVSAPPPERATQGVLTAPASFAETFPGEVREMVISALTDARDTARQGSQERRAMVLDAVLTTNRASGELDRRRAELKQALKDCGYYTNPKSLEKLGFRLVSGRTHWKLEYGGVRMPIAKTPSDYRATLNISTDLANRCF